MNQLINQPITEETNLSILQKSMNNTNNLKNAVKRNNIEHNDVNEAGWTPTLRAS